MDYPAKDAIAKQAEPRVVAIFTALMLSIVLMPVLEITQLPLMDLLMTLIILGGIGVAGESKRSLVIGLFLGIPAVSFNWLSSYHETNFTVIASYVLNSALFLYVFVLMVRKIFRSPRVNLEVILAAVSCYFLIAIVFLMVYIALEFIDPDSFSTPPPEYDGEMMANLHYFSFVTLTTLGYGDITPTSPLARSLAVLEAISGVLFTAVILARLISSYEVQAIQKEEKEEKEEEEE